MKLGINLPQFGRYASPEDIAQVAQEAERLGCEAVWVQERLLRPSHPRQPYAGFMDPWPENYRVVFDPIGTLTSTWRRLGDR
jgi:alkanesulfonate monooxygenase SsuD/methylene tetrahydromethanopterin reductase-like flavin-dependent oxidoreductase (luciferase family)